MALNFNFGPFTASNFGLEPIDLSKVSAPLSNAEIFASASRAASSPVFSGALSSVSTTPTFNSADYGPPSPVVSAPTVDENKVIQDYVNATMASNPNDWVDIVAQRMDEVGVSPSRLQQAFPDLSVEQIQQSYEEARPTGKYSTPTETITINKDFTPAPLSNVETLNIGSQLGTVQPTTTFDAGEFVGPVLQRDVTSKLPSGWTSYSPEQKINWFNQNNVTTQELLDAGVPQTDIDEMKSQPNGYKDESTKSDITSPFSKRIQAEEDVRQAFQRVLGRDPGSQLDFWTNELVNGGVTLANLDSLLRSTEIPKPETRYNDWAESLEKPLFNSYDEVIEQINKETPAGYLTDFGLGRGWNLGVVPKEARDKILGGDNQFPELEQFGGTLTNDQLKKLFVDSTGVSSPDALYAWYSDDWGSNDVLDLNVYDIMQEKGSNPDQGIFATDQFLSNNLKDLQENFGIDEATLRIALNKVVAEKGSEYIGNSAVYNVHGIIADTARTSLASLGRLDADTEAQLNDFTKVGEDALQERLRIIEELNKQKDNGLGFVLAVGSAFFAPSLGPQIGAAMGYKGATAAAVGAGVLSGTTQLAVNGKIDPGSLLLSVGGAYLGATGNLTGSDIAADAAQLAEQGLSSAQIADTLVASGVNSVTANLAGTFASAGISADIAPMITAGTQNMGLTALAMGELDADALTKSFLTGAGGEASSLAVDKVIGAENLKLIADATGLTQDQVGSIATSALMNGINSEVTGTNNFFDSVVQTLVVSGVSTVTANKVATALDETTSSKGRAAIVGAAKNIMDVAGTAAWNEMDIGDALEAMAPTIIGNAIATYVRTPDIAKTDDKDKTTDAPVAKTTQLSESEIANQLEENLIFDGRQATSQEQAATQARNSGFNTFIYDNKTYTISPDAKPIDLSESRIKQDLDEGLLYDGRDAKSLNDAAQLARKEGINTFIYGDKTYTIPSQAELREGANLEISKQTTFDSAFSKARELLGPGQTFDWQGKSYSTATAEERPDLVTVKPGDVTQTDTGAAFHQNIGKKYTPEEMRILEMAVSENAASPDQIDLKNKDDEGATAQYMSNLFFGGAFKDFKAEDLPLIGGLLKTAAKNQGIGLDGLGNQLKDYSTSYSLVTGTPFETSMQRIGDGLIAYGKELGSEEYLKEINQFNNDYIQQASKARPDGLGKSAWDRYTDWWSMARDNPGAAAGSVLYELGQETLPLAAAATVILAAPTAIGAGTAITLGAVTSALLDANEVFGNTGADRYQYGIANGESEDLARTNAIKEAGVNAFATLGTEFLADRSLMGLYTGGLKTSLALGLGATKAITANWGGEYVESLAHTYNTAAQRGIPIDDAFHNNARSIAVLEATIGKNTAASIVSPALVSSVAIGINENGQDITLEDIRSGNETLASVKLDAPVNVTESGDTLTLGGLTAILKQNDAPVDFKLNADTPVFEKADGSVVTYNDLQFQASNNGQSFGEVIQNLSNNQIVIPKELTTVADISGPTNIDITRGGVTTDPTIEVDPTIKTDIKVDPTTGTETEIKVDPDTNIATEIKTETNPDTGIETKTETAVNPDTNIATEIKTEVNPDSNVTTKIETNINQDTNTVVEVKTETNPEIGTETNTVINTDTNIKTEINVDTNTVVATETNLDTNIKTDITTNVDKIIADLVDTGVKPADALKIAVEEVTENAKSTNLTTAKKAAGIGGAAMFMSTPYEETDFDHQGLYTKGKVKPFEGVLDEFMKRFESESSTPDQITTKPESKMDSDYFVYGSQTDIDDVLSQTPPNTIPTLNVPAFGMRTGGLVPPFAGGGPLTMAAGKLRKDYRQGDAVEGPGDGQSDDIPAMLADGEFVLPADVVAALGNGSNKAGADKLYDMMHNIRRQARQGKPKDLPKPAKSPLQYITRR